MEGERVKDDPGGIKVPTEWLSGKLGQGRLPGISGANPGVYSP